MDFPRRERESARTKSKGKNFWEEAKQAHDTLFADFVKQADAYSSLETYTAALQEESWHLAEQLMKKSWHNGVASGRDRQSGTDR